MKKQTILLLLLLSLASVVARGEVSVSGKVVDNTGEPLIGVNILLQGTTSGTLTNFDGEFFMDVPSSSSVLVVSYMGFETRELKAGNGMLGTIMLEETAQNIDEIVVVGYGVQKKSHLTGAVSKYSDDNLGNQAVSRLDQALQGKIAGVNISNVSSEAGSAPQVRVRGMGSISASNEPLVVVDGYPMADGLSFIDMNDVESIEVLKDAASAAIYGSRGANGVILITTKSGDIQKAKYSIKAYTGFKQAYKLHDLQDSHDYVRMLYDEAALGGAGPTVSEKAWLSIDNHTDWQREALRNVANITNVQFSVSGGKKEAKYYISGSYTGDQGIMINSRYDKFNVRAKVNATLSKYVEIGVNMSPSYTKRESPATNFIDFYRTYSWLPVTHTEATAALTGQPIGSYAHGRHFNNLDYTDVDGNVFTASPWGTNNNNPRCVMDNEKRYAEDYRLNTSAYININIVKGLTFRSQDGFYVQYRDNNTYHNANAKSDGDANYALYTNRLRIDLLSENTLNYNATWGKHEFGAMAGFTANKVRLRTAGIKGIAFPTDYVHTINAATDITIEENDGTRRTYTMEEEEMLLSVLARINYSYAGRYLASVSFRADGSSKFGPENQWGYFPSVSLGWRMSEEEWLKDQRWLNQLKIRGSWGVTGNNDIVNYAAYDKLSAANYTFGTTNQLAAGLANTGSVLGNRHISWEQTNEFDVGFDLSMFKTRVNLTVDYYYSITRSLLFQQPALAITGYTNYWNNIGKVRNQGVEIELTTYNIKTKKFEWQTQLNLSTNNNRLLQLGDGSERLLSYGERSEVYVARVGGPSIQYYGYRTDGVWTSQEEIDAFLNGRAATDVFLVGKTVVPGTLKVVDTDGNQVIDAYDREALGNPFPTMTWGMTNTFTFYGFDVSFMLQGVAGVTVLNGDGYYQETKKINRAYTANRFVSAEQPGDGRTPTFANGNGMAWELTDYLLQNASYGALKDLTIGYRFNKKQLRPVHLNTIRLYFSGQNLAYVWGKSYKGINPEARYTSNQYSSPLIDGYQRGGFPIQRTYTIGVEIGF
ncbi:MAG: TonB-dependent receptor [Paludibacteraceae bacterium]|nr:TonB-dependent receptor [Paludibacteraceae bacterium]